MCMVNQVRVVMGRSVLSKMIPHPLSQFLDCLMCYLYSLCIFSPLTCPFLCLCPAVTCSEDMIVLLVCVCPPLPEGEGLVGCEFRGFLYNCMGPENDDWFHHWNWRWHGEAGKTGWLVVLEM